MQQEDEAIISTSHTAIASTSQSTTQNNNASSSSSVPKKSNAAAAATNGKAANNTNRDRTLVKTSLVADASKGGTFVGAKMSLEDFGNSQGGSFNQFAGKTSTYSDDLYSTKLDMSNVSRDVQQRAMQVEKQIMGTATSNRHVAEERNQVSQSAEQEQDGNKNDDEEAKYGATDRRNKTEVANQDGGVFKTAAKKGKGKKNNKITAPAGKFQTFHASIDKKALSDVTSAFVKQFVQKRSSDSFLNEDRKNENNRNYTNLQQQQILIAPNF